jgi:cold shock CspA family protein
MLTGTISDYDAHGLFGLIDADDGRLVLFNLQDVKPPARDQFHVGTRVEFVEQTGSLAPRASNLSATSTSRGDFPKGKHSL